MNWNWNQPTAAGQTGRFFYCGRGMLGCPIGHGELAGRGARATQPTRLAFHTGFS
ncbi:hypothetical protein [Thiospirillum jenense]|uniref:Uncharacterized protein n=1 Tax=Thiospirillum jenense TaxID=1653858 RepID=A0A839HBF4_9GAMM|nr:hypothetical protein [Thiospirillum jenense]MBB1126041.1 hypothetical protein [Thiospirillum jenense]